MRTLNSIMKNLCIVFLISFSSLAFSDVLTQKPHSVLVDGDLSELRAGKNEFYSIQKTSKTLQMFKLSEQKMNIISKYCESLTSNKFPEIYYSVTSYNPPQNSVKLHNLYIKTTNEITQCNTNISEYLNQLVSDEKINNYLLKNKNMGRDISSWKGNCKPIKVTKNDLNHLLNVFKENLKRMEGRACKNLQNIVKKPNDHNQNKKKILKN